MSRCPGGELGSRNLPTGCEFCPGVSVSCSVFTLGVSALSEEHGCGFEDSVDLSPLTPGLDLPLESDPLSQLSANSGRCVCSITRRLSLYFTESW